MPRILQQPKDYPTLNPEAPSKQMSLSPRVFRDVLHEYRANSPANYDTVLNAIERLPDKYLFESDWVSARALTLEENKRVCVLNRTLRSKRELSRDEVFAIENELVLGYRLLFDSGITDTCDRIRLAGAPLSAGFWKSFVEVERGKRWTWDDDSFADKIMLNIGRRIRKECGSCGYMNLGNNSGIEALNALNSLRHGNIPSEFDDGMSELIACALFALDNHVSCAVDVAFQVSSPAGKHVYYARYMEKDHEMLQQQVFSGWIEANAKLLAGNDIVVQMIDYHRWDIPTDKELHRLGRVSGYKIPDAFGPSLLDDALNRFKAEDLVGCAACFEDMLVYKEEDVIRNNLAFCQLLLGQTSKAIANAQVAMESDYEPLYEMNKGLGEYLEGRGSIAKASLENALNQLNTRKSEFDPTAVIYTLVLDASVKKVNHYADLPIDAAILLNLWRMGQLSPKELREKLTTCYPEKVNTWIDIFSVPNGDEVQRD